MTRALTRPEHNVAVPAAVRRSVEPADAAGGCS